MTSIGRSTGGSQVSCPFLSPAARSATVEAQGKTHTIPQTQENQVTPFPLETVDGETLYAWHVLPLSTYLRNEEKLQAQPSGFTKDFTSTESFKALRDDPDARLVVVCKGNTPPI